MKYNKKTFYNLDVSIQIQHNPINDIDNIEYVTIEFVNCDNEKLMQYDANKEVFFYKVPMGIKQAFQGKTYGYKIIEKRKNYGS